MDNTCICLFWFSIPISDGTTDVTRTMHFGVPSEEEKEAFTLVLLGNLDVTNFYFCFVIN